MGGKQADLGDFPAALETVKLIENQIKEERTKKGARDPVLTYIIRAQAKRGDTTSALRTVDALQGSQPEKDKALLMLADGQAESDAPGALRTANGITNQDLKERAFAMIAQAQVKAGDVAGAKLTAAKLTSAEMKESALKGPDPDDASRIRCHGYLDLAEALLKNSQLITW